MANSNSSNPQRVDYRNAPWLTPNMWKVDARGRKSINLNYAGQWLTWPSNFGQANSFLIHMPRDHPGEYYTDNGTSVPIEVATKAGVPVRDHLFAKRKAELMAKATALVDKQMDALNKRVEAAVEAELKADA